MARPVYLLIIGYFIIKCSAESVCFHGYVMDRYCINLGTLVDNPSVSTLEGPEQHSVHCLADVGSCYTSTFELVTLEPGVGKGNLHCRAYTLDQQGRRLALDMARSVGNCDTCENGDLQRGFNVVVVGTTDGLTFGDVPPLLTVSQILPPNSTCPGNIRKANTTVLGENCIVEFGERRSLIIAHASFMLIGWGFLLPLGILSARYLKYCEDAFWFKVHSRLQPFGLILTIIGFLIALANFDVFAVEFNDTTIHGIVGIIVMSLGMLQPVNAFFRPHPPEKGMEKPRNRLLWEIIHKSSGYIAIILAGGNIVFGIAITGLVSVGIIYVIFLLFLLSFVIYHKVKARRKKHNLESQHKRNDSQENISLLDS